MIINCNKLYTISYKLYEILYKLIYYFCKKSFMIGEKIRKIRILKGYSQEFVSEKLNIKQPEYSKIENDKSKITLNIIEKLSHLFEINVIEIINFNDEKAFKTNYNEKSNDLFNIEKILIDSFDNERNSYLNQIKHLEEEILYLRKKIDEKCLH